MALPDPRAIRLISCPVLGAEQTSLNADIRELVSPDSCDSGFRFGIVEIDVGEEVRWSFERADNTSDGEAFLGWSETAYFVLEGKLRLTWDERSHLEVDREDALYVPPGHRYRLRSIGYGPARMVFVTTAFAPREQRRLARRNLPAS